MPYVRKRGNHLAIVHGARASGTGKVEQQVLMTIHSKAEALAAAGRGAAQHGRSFRAWMEDRYPAVRFQWAKISAALDQMQAELPDLAKSREARALDGFQAALDELTRHIVAADPHLLDSARHLLERHRFELRWLVDLLSWRLEGLEQGKPSEWSRDPFGWRLALSRGTMNPELEEGLAEHLAAGDLDRADALFRFVVRMYPDYAEGWNYLGLVALRRGQLEEALRCFETCEVEGRKLFPARIAKRDYWLRLETRPYIRGLRNQWLVLNRLGRHSAALRIAERLERECGDELSAVEFRAVSYLNAGEWQLARENARRGAEHASELSLLAAFASFELREPDEARAQLVQAMTTNRRCTGIVLGKRMPQPKEYIEVVDHDIGVELTASIGGYLDARSRAARGFFSRVWREEAGR